MGTAGLFHMLLALCVWLFLVAYTIRFHTHQDAETQPQLIDVARSEGKGREAQSSGIGFDLAFVDLLTCPVHSCGDVCCSQMALK